MTILKPCRRGGLAHSLIMPGLDASHWLILLAAVFAVARRRARGAAAKSTSARPARNGAAPAGQSVARADHGNAGGFVMKRKTNPACATSLRLRFRVMRESEAAFGPGKTELLAGVAAWCAFAVR